MNLDPNLMAGLGVAFVFGTFIGSFLNVCIHRLPRNLSVVHPPSRCGACGTNIPWHDNLPVIGWLLLWGRCRACGTRFSPRYLFAELACGLLTAGTVWWALSRPLLVSSTAFDPFMIVGGVAVLLAFVWWLAVCAVIDLDHTIIPDELTKPFQLAAPFLAVLAATGLAIEQEALPIQWGIHLDVFGAITHQPTTLMAWMGSLGGGAVLLLLASLPLARRIYGPHGWTEEDHRGFAVGVRWFAVCTTLHTLACVGAVALWGVTAWTILLAQALLGSLAGWFSLYLVGFLGTLAFRRNAMGFGDVKFLAPIGAFVGPLGVVYLFFTASVVGALVGIPRRLLGGSREIPFGPFLALATLVVLVAGGWIHGWFFGRLFALSP